MPLEMRGECEHCHVALACDADAAICVVECTFCPACADAMQYVCPNCGGELARPPRPGATRIAAGTVA